MFQPGTQCALQISVCTADLRRLIFHSNYSPVEASWQELNPFNNRPAQVSSQHSFLKTHLNNDELMPESTWPFRCQTPSI